MASSILKIGTVLIGQTINMLIGFLTLPYLARALSVTDNGTYGQVLLIVLIFNSILQLGLPSVLYVFLTRKDLDDESVLRSNVSMLLVIGLIGSIAVFLLAPVFGAQFENPAVVNLLRIYTWSLPFNLLFLGFNSFLIHNSKVRQSMTAIVLSNVVKITLLIIAIQVYKSLEYAFMALVVAEILQFILVAWFSSSITRIFGKPSWSLSKQQLMLGVPLGLSAMLGMLMNQTDSFMVGKYLTTEEFAIFRNGAIAIPFVSVLFSSISAIALPEFAKHFEAGNLETIVKLKNKVISNSAALIYPLIFGILFFAKSLMVMYLSSVYAASAIVFIVYNLIIVFRVNNYRDVLIASKNTQYILKVVGIAFLINIPLNYLFINQFGYVGPAISTFIARMILVSFFTYKSLSILNIKLNEFVEVPKMIRIIAYSSLISLGFLLLHQWIQVNALILPYIGITAISCYLIYLRNNLLDIDIVTKITEKIPVFGARITSRILGFVR